MPEAELAGCSEKLGLKPPRSQALVLLLLAEEPGANVTSQDASGKGRGMGMFAPGPGIQTAEA